MQFLADTLANPEHLEPSFFELESGVRMEFLKTGILRIRPAENAEPKAERRVLISCGIHGNETAPMEIVDQLVSEICTGDLPVAEELLFVIGNPPAANSAERFVDENLNRLFSGKHRQSTTSEAARAALLEQQSHDFFANTDLSCLHYDLHTAIRDSEFEKFVVCPFLHERDWSIEQLAFLEACGIQAALLSNQPAATYSYFTAHQFGADSFTVELGKVRKFGDNDLSSFAKVFDGLRRVISGNEAFSQSPETLQVFEVIEEVIKRTDAFQLHIDSDANNFTELKQGALLASDQDYQYRTQSDGERFVFPISNVPCGQRAMLVIAPTTLSLTKP